MDINDLIYAYSLGCLDPEDHQKFNNLNDNEFDSKELGEYQNLVSLLPIILTIETPDPLLKDNVAKKLYSLKEQKKTVIPSIWDLKNKENDSPVKENINSDNYISNDEKSLNEQVDDKKLSAEDIKNNPPIDKTIIYPFAQNLKEIENDRNQILENDTSNLTGYRSYSSRFPESSRRGTSKLTWGIFLFALLSIGLFIAYLNISSKTNDLNYEVERLKMEVFQLNLQLKSTKEMQDIVQSPDVFTINLTGTDLYKSGFGKLFIDSVKGLGYIQLGQMPGIAEVKVFQLWAKFSGKIISLGTFHVPDKGGFYSFSIKNMPYEELINFFITQEPASGSTSPGNKVYLQGTYNP